MSGTAEDVYLTPPATEKLSPIASSRVEDIKQSINVNVDSTTSREHRLSFQLQQWWLAEEPMPTVEAQEPDTIDCSAMNTAVAELQATLHVPISPKLSALSSNAPEAQQLFNHDHLLRSPEFTPSEAGSLPVGVQTEPVTPFQQACNSLPDSPFMGTRAQSQPPELFHEPLPSDNLHQPPIPELVPHFAPQPSPYDCSSPMPGPYYAPGIVHTPLLQPHTFPPPQYQQPSAPVLSRNGMHIGEPTTRVRKSHRRHQTADLDRSGRSRRHHPYPPAIARRPQPGVGPTSAPGSGHGLGIVGLEDGLGGRGGYGEQDQCLQVQQEIRMLLERALELMSRGGRM